MNKLTLSNFSKLSLCLFRDIVYLKGHIHAACFGIAEDEYDPPSARHSAYCPATVSDEDYAESKATKAIATKATGQKSRKGWKIFPLQPAVGVGEIRIPSLKDDGKTASRQ